LIQKYNIYCDIRFLHYIYCGLGDQVGTVLAPSAGRLMVRNPVWSNQRLTNLNLLIPLLAFNM